MNLIMPINTYFLDFVLNYLIEQGFFCNFPLHPLLVIYKF